ncbi:nuclear transport factor 2 family protein [Actinomycetospora sp. OC33-EN08]|uniref:Nuclear transport factor 2 family protein n=1 Tax=Actinomycetospora aurantiaca TaxID=3129233 RepID=A0ABU8MQY6_9PSEU
MATIEALMHANLLEVFGERDPDRRAAAIARTYAPDVVFSDPEESLTGHDALGAKAQSLLDQAPGFVFAADGPVHVVDDLGHLSWTLGPEGGDPVVRGTDIALVRDGVIARLYTFLR